MVAWAGQEDWPWQVCNDRGSDSRICTQF